MTIANASPHAFNMATPVVPSKEALTRLDAQLTCSICIDRYTDPRTLPCLHSFCKNCIGRIPVKLEGGRYLVECPVCRKPTQLGDRGASAFPTAFHINNLLEIDELLRTTPADEPHQECPAHKRPRDIYCETCEEFVCFKCVTETHHGHRCDRAADLFEKHKEQIEACLQPVKERVDEVTQTLEQFDTREMEIRSTGEVVKNTIDRTILNLKDRLEKMRKTLTEDVDSAIQQKLQLHSCQRAEVEIALVQLKSCQEFVEEELRLRSQHQIQTAKKRLVQRIRDTHSKVKVSELQPAQRADTEFLENQEVLSTCSCVGVVRSTLNYSTPGLFVVDIPECVIAGSRVEVTLTTPILLPPVILSCQLTPAHMNRSVSCPVRAVGRDQYRVMIHPLSDLQHQLRVQKDGVDIYGSPFTVQVLSLPKIREKNLTEFASGLKGPCGIAVIDECKLVVVAEWDGHRVTVLSSTGEVVTRFGEHGSGHGQLTNPWGVAITADNHIIVADAHMLQKFTFDGSPVASINLSSYGVAIHKDGRVFYTNWYGHKIDVVDHSLNYCYSLGDVYLKEPRDVAIDTKGMVYVTDSSKHEVLKFTPEGQYLTSIGSGGKRPDQFSKPLGICIDSDDIIYITDREKHRVMLFTAEGEFLGSFGGTGRQGLQPRGVAVDKSGNLFVCDVTGKVSVSRLDYSEQD